MTMIEYMKSCRSLSEVQVAALTRKHDAQSVPCQVREDAAKGHAESMARGR